MQAKHTRLNKRCGAQWRPEPNQSCFQGLRCVVSRCVWQQRSSDARSTCVARYSWASGQVLAFVNSWAAEPKPICTTSGVACFECIVSRRHGRRLSVALCSCFGSGELACFADWRRSNATCLHIDAINVWLVLRGALSSIARVSIGKHFSRDVPVDSVLNS